MCLGVDEKVRGQGHELRSSAEIEQWIADARAGSSEALGRLVESFWPYLVWLANRELDAQVQAKVGASDLVQETFLRAQQGFGEFRGRTDEELLAWLRQILRRNLANLTRQFRAEKRKVARERPLDSNASNDIRSTDLPAAGQSPSSFFVRKEEIERLTRAVNRLPEDYRRAIMLRYWEHRSFEEIGRTLGRSAEAARKLWARAIERLELELDAGHEPKS
jgi:RNA polymerase sigma-70 factor, ECF subfamily